jgi:WD40 repeat protein
MGAMGTGTDPVSSVEHNGEVPSRPLRSLIERLGLLPTPPAGSAYHGFISYSHAADGRLAPAVEKGLKRFAKPWYQASALRIFRDQAALPVTHDLWHTIESALDNSEHYVLLASEQAAGSPWVAKEVEHWRRTKSSENLHIALTDGEIAWDNEAEDFDWKRTSALPQSLRNAFEHEPLHVDFRWARGRNDLTLNNNQFRGAIAALAAPMHGKARDELESEEADLKRKSLRLARTVALVLVLLFALAVFGGVFALNERNSAIDEAHAAQSQLLASQAISSTSNLQLASLLAVSAYRLSPTANARSAILTVADNPHFSTPLTGHTNWVNSVAFSPNGALLASGSTDDTIRLWDLATNRQSGAPLTGDSATVESVAFSPDGKTLLSGSDDGTVRLWNVVTHEFERGAQVGDRVNTVAFSPTGRTIAAGDDKGLVRLWSYPQGAYLGAIKADSDRLMSVAFSPDGRTLASGGFDGRIRLWNVATRRQIGATFDQDTNAVMSVAFSPDGRLLASGSEDGDTRLWSMANQQQLGQPLTSVNTGGVDAVAFSPDGSTLASGGDYGDIRLFDVPGGQPIGAPLTGHTNVVTSLAFSPDGDTLASGSADSTIRLWDARSRQLGAPLPAGWVNTVAFSPDAKTLASGAGANPGEGAIQLWDAATRRPIGTPLLTGAEPVLSVAFSPGGKLLASGGEDDEIRIWNVATHAQIGTPLKGDTDWINSVAFSPDGKLLASGSGDAIVRLWNVVTKQEVGAPLELGPTLPGTDGNAAMSVAFSPDGTLLAAGGDDGTIRIWNVATGKQIGQRFYADAFGVLSLAFSPDGRTLAAGSRDGTVRLWNVTTHRQIGTPLASSADQVRAVAFSPDGRTLAATDGNSISLWDVASHQQLGTPLTGHSDSVLTVAFSPSGTTLASGSQDGTIRFWSYYPITDYIRQLCANIDPSQARALFRQADPTIPYRPVCG